VRRSEEQLPPVTRCDEPAFGKLENRLAAQRLAEEVQADLIVVEVVCLQDVVAQRLRERFGDESEAGFQECLQAKETFEALMEGHLRIDNSGTLQDLEVRLGTYF